MKRTELVKLATAIKAAAEHTKAVADFEAWDDGGTCNFDAPYLSAKGMTEKQCDEITKLSGVRCWLSSASGFFGRRLNIAGHLEGQGNRRTKMAEETKRHLCTAGIEAFVFYMMD